MGCSSGGCSSGRGGLPAGCNNNGACGTGGGCDKLHVFDWLANMRLPGSQKPFDLVEVRFKNTRKEFFRNVNELPLKIGDAIAVEAQNGHDIGTVSLTGELVKIQMKKKGLDVAADDYRKIYRLAKDTDIEKWKQSIDLETPTMIKARIISTKLKLNMKISDVEVQGDKSKAIFYYTAEDRVDFRELIRQYAEEFKFRIEMKQIGTRQEAGRVGGIGSCGRELCCSTWLTDFRSVNTNAARYQQLSMNPQKLAGQCGKLKCCLNYELDSYIDAQKDFPDTNTRLDTKEGWMYHFKSDIFKRTVTFVRKDENHVDQFATLTVEQVNTVLELNKKGIKADRLTDSKPEKLAKPEIVFQNSMGEDSITRFDKQRGGGSGGGNNKNRNNRNKPNRNPNPNPNPVQGANPNANRNPNPPKNPNSGQAPNPNRNPNQGQNPNPNRNPNRNPNQNPNRNPNQNRPNPNQPNPNKPE